jgi:ketosteroid isomerase-like protein|tara:strand:- start:1466 stop:2383 length:918 start_codon:yes stop_codon:yes gene_type:complete
MKKHIIYLFVLCFSFSFSQKKNNGKLYIEHPAMDVVEQFNKAFVSGDLETMKSLVSDDFRWYTLSMREPGTLQQLLNRSNYLSKNVVKFDIKHYGGAYPDALEYKKDDVLEVMTYTWMSGYDRNTGVELDMPRYVNFRINDDGKISRMNVMDDQALWTKAYQAWDTRANGVIYKDHPLVTKVRLMMRDYETQDVEKIKSNYTENTRFYDVMNSPVDEFKSLEEEFAQFNDYMEVFELVNIRESGYPDVLDYEGNGAVVISWWEMTLRNKKSGKTNTIMQHIQHSFNEKGEIVREDYYFNPAQLPK